MKLFEAYQKLEDKINELLNEEIVSYRTIISPYINGGVLYFNSEVVVELKNDVYVSLEEFDVSDTHIKGILSKMLGLEEEKFKLNNTIYTCVNDETLYNYFMQINNYYDMIEETCYMCYTIDKNDNVVLHLNSLEDEKNFHSVIGVSLHDALQKLFLSWCY